jgi:hypothetical protein
VRDHHLISYLHDRNHTRVKVLGAEDMPELNRDEASISDGPPTGRTRFHSRLYPG